MKYLFQDLVDLDKIKPLTDSFCDIFGIASSIGELDGTRLLSSGDKKLCLDFHRAHPISSKACDFSRTTLIEGMLKGKKYVIYNCQNGLNDAAAPIKIRNEHVANFYIGQFFFDPPDISNFCEQAKKYGYEEKPYLDALNEIPTIPKERIIKFLDFVTAFAGVLGELGLKHIEELEESSNEIKVLSGLLPICASCKKIRDDKGYWNQIETYIRDHSEVEFSHGICPECAKKLYRDLLNEEG